MNYIKQLQHDNKDKDETIEKLREMLFELRKYALSDKFQGNCELSGYMNIRDVLLRTEEN